MKTRRFCPQCGRPLYKSNLKQFNFQCYNCDKDFTRIEVLRKTDLSKVKKLRYHSYLDDLWRREYPHSHKKPYPKKSKKYIRIRPQVPKYTQETLIKLNESYHYDHGIMESDVDMANTYVRIIESSRSDRQPRNGDMIRLTTKYGDYYHYAHLEKLNEHGFSVCERPYIPFIFSHSTKNSISCSTSGGAWLSIPPKALKYIGKDEKYFKNWGWCGARGNGAVCFKAEVSVWEYIEPDPIFDDYTTKDWRRLYISKDITSEYLYYGNGIAFKTQAELDEYISLFKGKLYNNPCQNSFVLWCYFQLDTKIPIDKWESLDLRIITFQKEPVKIEIDDVKHTITLYKYCK